MTFTDFVKNILVSVSKPLTPQEIRELIKTRYPDYYGTLSHRDNVEKGHYKNLDHALLAQIYSLVRMNGFFSRDTSCKPMLIALRENGLIIKNHQPVVKSQIVTQKIPDRKSILNNEEELIKNMGHYYKRSLDVLKDFGGPSIYFHVQTIKEQESNFLSDRHIELIYATLVSWGMHKMGDPGVTKAKMVGFTEFKKSILNHREQLEKMALLSMDLCSQDEYEKCIDQLKQIYYNLKVSISDATIVANSKTLAHILPNLIPPIDRQYTIRFFTQEAKNFFSKTGKFKLLSLPQGIDPQFADFKRYCCRIKMMFDQCEIQLFSIDKESFNTSYPKIMDNLIMAYVKDVQRPVSGVEFKHSIQANMIQTAPSPLQI